MIDRQIKVIEFIGFLLRARRPSFKRLRGAEKYSLLSDM